jgi:hypothetical protein
VVHVALGDVVVHQRVGRLDRRLDLVRARLHAARDPHHCDRRRHAGQHDVEDRLVDREVDAADVDRDPGVELELVLGLERGVGLALDAKDAGDGDGDAEERGEREQELDSPAHRAAPPL